jgi:hypothetical protein
MPLLPLEQFKSTEFLEITNKMQPCNWIYYSKIYWKLNMFRATYRSSSGAPNRICSLWFIYTCGDRPLSRLGGNSWWAVCRSKHVEPSINFGIINSITRLFLVYFYWFILRCTDQWILNPFYAPLIHTAMHGSMNIKSILCSTRDISVTRIRPSGLHF